MSNSTLAYGIFTDLTIFPAWYHAVNVWYFVTNLYMMYIIGWINKSMDVPDAWTWIITFGLIGGLIEHTSPYIPALTVTVEQEIVWFRIPTVVPALVSGLYLVIHPAIQTRAKWATLSVMPSALYVSYDFFEQETASSLNWHPFHSKHTWLPHLYGPVVLTFMYFLTTLRKETKKSKDD